MSNSPSFVSTTINFGIKPADNSRAYQYISYDPNIGKQMNWSFEEKEVQVENIRGKEETVSLHTAGFQFYNNRPSKLKSFSNDEEIQKEYYPECEELLKELTGATKVLIFDHSMCTWM